MCSSASSAAAATWSSAVKVFTVSGSKALQSEDHRLVGAVAPAGGAERAEEFGLHPGGGAQVPVALESVGEQLRRPHRAHRV